jgi:hypothetical protein
MCAFIHPHLCSSWSAARVVTPLLVGPTHPPPTPSLPHLFNCLHPWHRIPLSNLHTLPWKSHHHWTCNGRDPAKYFMPKGKKITTKINPTSMWWDAEDYHQLYLCLLVSRKCVLLSFLIRVGRSHSPLCPLISSWCVRRSSLICVCRTHTLLPSHVHVLVLSHPRSMYSGHLCPLVSRKCVLSSVFAILTPPFALSPGSACFCLPSCISSHPSLPYASLLAVVHCCRIIRAIYNASVRFTLLLVKYQPSSWLKLTKDRLKFVSEIQPSNSWI